MIAVWVAAIPPDTNPQLHDYIIPDPRVFVWQVPEFLFDDDSRYPNAWDDAPHPPFPLSHDII